MANKIAKKATPFPLPKQMHMHLLETQDLTTDILHQIFKRANVLAGMEKEGRYDRCLENHSVIFLHDQPSTRTVESYAEATKGLRGTYRSVSIGDSSVKKEETLDATVMTYGEIGKSIVIIRYSDESALLRAAVRSRIPLINAGSGTGQHPSQYILDAKTIWDVQRTLNHTSIAFVGNVGESRVISSMLYGLAQFHGCRMFIVSPEKMRIDGHLRWHLHKRQLAGHVEIIETTDMHWALRQVNFAYWTRDYKEMSKQPEDLGGLNHLWLTRGILEQYPDLKVMHALPHNDEMPAELEDHPQVLIRHQMRNGRWTRQAWLQMLAENFLNKRSA